MPGPEPILPDWVRAHGKPLFQGRIKHEPADFIVDEILGFVPSGSGEHDFLLVEKTDANTVWVARQFAKHAHVPLRDVGYAGLKDRRAVTTQWFSIRRPTREGTDWDSFDLPGVRILKAERHSRKLKRGAHAGNEFRLNVRHSMALSDAVEKRFRAIAELGVPNYFGPQRFGLNGNNLRLAQELFAGRRLGREQRSIALSAARSFLFNEILSVRIADGTWNQAKVGDAVNLDGTGSFFVADSVDDDLTERIRSLDVHPTGPLWGAGDAQNAGWPAELEAEIAYRFRDLAHGLEQAGVNMARRPHRLAVRDLTADTTGDFTRMRFRLGRGGYATSVIRELGDVADA